MQHTMEDPLANLTQAWPLPTAARPIVIIGAGGIVNDSHLPAYRSAGFDVAAVFDVDQRAAAECAGRWGISSVCPTLADAASQEGVVFDVAIPPDSIYDTIARLPDGATVLIQKPLGVDLADARRITELCGAKGLTAAVNFQLRFSPMMLALRDVIARGVLGGLVDCDVRVACHTPWHIWPFLERLPRMEILQHSVHYLDAIRMFFGEPAAVLARTVKHPACPDLASTRSNVILDFGPDVRCCVSTNHHHRWGPRFAASEFRIEGERGAAVAKMGVNLNYPEGEPDQLCIATDASGWREIDLRGNWFPHAFEGPMSNLQRFAAGEDDALLTGVDDSLRTMALVEACYESNDVGGTSLPDIELRAPTDGGPRS